PYAGDYGLGDDIKDITKVPITKLLKYNATDARSTNWVYDQYLQRVTDMGCLDLYRELFLPYQEVLIYAELCGVPIDPEAVQKNSLKLQRLIHEVQIKIQASPYYQEAQYVIQSKTMAAYNDSHK